MTIAEDIALRDGSQHKPEPLVISPSSVNSLALVLTFLFPILLLSAVFLQPIAEPKWMFLDTLAAAEMAPMCCHVYYGLISNTGLILWIGASAVCLLVGLAFLSHAGSDSFTRFALSAGALSGWIALDDMFLVHEKVMPALGVPQTLVVLSYVGLALLYVATSWRFVLRHHWWLLFLGGGALGVSVFVDLVFHSVAPVFVYLEDSAKFFGIVCWCSFHVLAVYNHLVSNLAAKSSNMVDRYS